MREAVAVAATVAMVLTVTLAGAVNLTTVPASGDVTVQVNDGTTVEYQSVSEFPQQPFINSEVAATRNGHRFGGTGGRIAVDPTITDGNGFAEVQAVEPNNTATLVVNATGRSRLEFSGDNLTFFEYRSVDYGSGQTDFRYTGSQSQTTIQFVDAPASGTPVRLINQSDGAVLAFNETTANGLNVQLPHSSHSVDSQSFANSAPDIENLRPENVTTNDVTLKANISDEDFNADEVNVSFFFDGTEVLDTNITSDQTVTHDINNVAGGEHNFTVVAEDFYGARSTAQQTVGVPGNLTIRNATNHSDVVDNAQVRIRAFDDDGNVVEIVERTTNDGTVNLTGFPATRQVTIQTRADNFSNRTTTLASIVGQQSVYLLPDNESSALTEFVVQDQTGEFSSRARLIIKRPINISGNLSYERVSGDILGADKTVSATLQQGIRYRVLIVGTDGSRRGLGPYVPSRDRTVTLEVSEISPPAEELEGPRLVTNQTDSELQLTYRDPNNQTERLRVVIHERGNFSNQLTTLTAGSASNPLGTATFTQQLSASEQNISWVANFTAGRGDQELTGTRVFGAQEFSLSLITDLDPGYRQIFGVGFLMVIAGIFSVRNARIGALLIPGVAMLLWQIGVLTQATTLLGIALAFSIAVGYNIIAVSGGVRPT